METIILQIKQTSLLEWVGTISGLVAVYLSVKEKILAWPIFIICYGVYAYLFFKASIFATMTLNAVFIPISLYGWWNWVKNSRISETNENETSIQTISKNYVIRGLALCFLGTISIAYLLSNYTEGAYPYLDAFATSLSLLAQWLLGKKYLENWLLWIVADICFIILCAVQEYYLSVLMFGVFTLLATKGYFDWKKGVKKCNG